MDEKAPSVAPYINRPLEDYAVLFTWIIINVLLFIRDYSYSWVNI